MSISQIISLVGTERVLVAKSADPIVENIDAAINILTALKRAWIEELAERDAALERISVALVRLVEGDKPVVKEAEQPVSIEPEAMGQEEANAA